MMSRLTLWEHFPQTLLLNNKIQQSFFGAETSAPIFLSVIYVYTCYFNGFMIKYIIYK